MGFLKKLARAFGLYSSQERERYLEKVEIVGKALEDRIKSRPYEPPRRYGQRGRHIPVVQDGEDVFDDGVSFASLPGPTPTINSMMNPVDMINLGYFDHDYISLTNHDNWDDDSLDSGWMDD